MTKKDKDRQNIVNLIGKVKNQNPHFSFIDNVIV